MFIPGLKWNQALAAAESASVSSTSVSVFVSVAVKKPDKLMFGALSIKKLILCLFGSF